MEAKLTRQSDVEVTLSISIHASQVAERLQQRLVATGKTMRLRGFRSGKVSPHAVSQRFSQDIRMEVCRDLVNEVLSEQIGKHELRPLAAPRVNDLAPPEEDEPLTFSAQIEVAPDIEFKKRGRKLKKLSLQHYIPALDEADLDAAMEELRLANPKWQATERAAAVGDKVICDFVGRLDGDRFEGGDASDIEIELGAGRMIAGFEEALIGALADEKRVFSVTFPEDYQHAELAAREAVFEAEIKEVLYPQEAELNDVLAARLAGESTENSTLEGLRESMRQRLQERLDSLCQRHTREAVIDALIEQYRFTLPPQLMARQRQGLEQQYSDMAEPEQLAVAEKMIRGELLLDTCAHAFELSADADAVQAEIVRQSQSWGDDPQQMVQAYYNNERLLNQVKATVRDRRVVDYLLEQSTSVRQQYLSYAEAVEMQEQQQQGAVEASGWWSSLWTKK